MHELRLCETRKYAPGLLEQWLNGLQGNAKSQRWSWVVKHGKARLLCSQDLSHHLVGSRSHSHTTQLGTPTYWVHQPRGPLLPIRRYPQMEDKMADLTFNPTQAWLREFTRREKGFVHFEFKAVSSKTQQRLLKKALDPRFEPDRKWDQWESKGWLGWTLRRFFGPWLRRTFRMNTNKPLEAQLQVRHDREDPHKAVLDKLSRPLFEVSIGLSHPWNSLWDSFSIPYLGILKVRQKKSNLLLSAEELATLLQVPDPLANAAYLATESSAHLPGPAQLNWHEEDRKRHLLVLGKTGMGKSSFLLQLLKEDVAQNRCTVLLDPHGDLVEDALKILPNPPPKVIVLDPSLEDFPLALNPLDNSDGTPPHLLASAMVEMFQALSQGSWGPRLEYILRNTLLTLLKIPNSTLLDLPRLLTQPTLLKHHLQNLNDLELERFWTKEFLASDERSRQEMISPILNKVGPILSHPIARNMFGQPKSKVRWELLLQPGNLVLLSLSKGKLGEDFSRMLGMIFVSLLHFHLHRKGAQDASQRSFLSLIVDEAQNLATPTFLRMLAEDRKYGLAMTLAHQYLEQFPPEIQSALLGNVGSLICFRSHPNDAEQLAPVLGLEALDLMQISPFQCYIKALKNGQSTPVFRWDTAPINPLPQGTSMQQVKESSAKRFGRPRLAIEKKLWSRYSEFT